MRLDVLRPSQSRAPWDEALSVGGALAQGVPARHQAQRLSSAHQVIIEPLQRGHVQAAAGLGESAVADLAHQGAGVVQGAEEGVQAGLLEAGSLAEQRSHQGRQGQTALPRKCTWVLGCRASWANSGEAIRARKSSIND